jgi:AraC-like DNA-binding protein
MQHFSCNDLPPTLRLPAWRKKVTQIFPRADVTDVDDLSFSGAITWRDLGPVMISSISSVAQTVTRSSADVDADWQDVFELNIQRIGQGLISQCGRTAQTPPGFLSLYDSARPFSMRFDGPFQQLSIRLPQTLLRQHVWNADALTAIALPADRGPGFALTQLTLSLMDESFDASDLSEPMIASALVQLVGACLMDQMAAQPAKSWGRRRTLRRLKDALLADMHDPALTPKKAAARCGISIRYAHDLFQMEGQTLGQWLRQQRLEAARQALLMPQNHGRTVADIAFAAGFSDAAYFSKTFKSVFGVTPSIVRSNTTKNTPQS